MSISLSPEPKILIARGDALGDVVLATVLIKPLKRMWPDCRIYFLVQQEYADVLRSVPEIDDVIIDLLPYDFKINDTYKLILQAGAVKKIKFDLFIGLWEKKRYAVMALFAGIRNRIGHGIFFLNRLLYTKTVKTKPLDFSRHQAEWNLSLLSILGINVNSEPVYLNPDQNIFNRLKKDCKLPEKAYCCFNLDAKGSQKRITARQNADIMEYLLKKNIPVVLTGRINTSELPEWLLQDYEQNPLIINTVGKLSIIEQMAVISGAGIFIGPDSGIAHIASGLKIKSLVYFLNKNQNPVRWGPWRNKNRIVKSRHACSIMCDSNNCTRMECRMLDIKEVYRSIDNLLQDDLLPDVEEEKLIRLKKGLNIAVEKKGNGLDIDVEGSGWEIYELPDISIRGLVRFIIKQNINLLILNRRSISIKYRLACMIASNYMHFYPEIDTSLSGYLTKVL
ncbi:MAG: glycosyltransferase family 9 protein [bacterium]|nr:glycosyltransferase family 9 protein [bacterium]